MHTFFLKQQPVLRSKNLYLQLFNNTVMFVIGGDEIHPIRRGRRGDESIGESCYGSKNTLRRRKALSPKSLHSYRSFWYSVKLSAFAHLAYHRIDIIISIAPHPEYHIIFVSNGHLKSFLFYTLKVYKLLIFDFN